MSARNLVLYTDGQESTFTDMREASLAFGRALNTTAREVRLVENVLHGQVTVAQLIRNLPKSTTHHRCVVCGDRHDGEDHHGYETTGARLLMQHEHGNHSQCHPGAGCQLNRKKEERRGSSG